MSEPTLETQGAKIVSIAITLRDSKLGERYLDEAKALSEELRTVINRASAQHGAVFMALFSTLLDVAEDYPEDRIQ